ncbi:hypothetical protein [Acrocarpospora sp. B8E8]|uniref:hypothetical protein n=1 Tax=Acrocarpospora sp. B8E8 TaxID=3153572 RepID=UPI00325EF8F8
MTELDRLRARVDELEKALAEIAETTSCLRSNRLAHKALGHVPNPHTVRLMAEIEADWAAKRSRS